MYQHATDDHLWAAHVQDNVPGHNITTPYPCPSFYALFRAHHPRWFLTRHKLWFSDTGLAGRLVIARYDQRRGCIEGYQLLARNLDPSAVPWASDPNVLASNFKPRVGLHLDNPVLELAPEPYASDHASEQGPVVLDQWEAPAPESPEAQPQSLAASTVTHRVLRRPPEPQQQATPPFRPVIHMGTRSLNYIQQSFVHAKRLSPDELTQRLSATRAFPYGHVWPPPSIDAPQRVLGAGLERPQTLRAGDRAANPREVCEHAFRIYKWLQIHRFQVGFERMYIRPPTAPFPTPSVANPTPSPAGQVPLPAGTTALGEEVSTYATLPADLYTPTPLRPLRGIFVGDYSAHGCEFLLLHQPPLPDPLPPPPPRAGEDESDEAYAVRCREALAWSGRVEAIKLTGDSNVPRGEVSFAAEEIGEGGTVGVETVGGLEGVRRVRGRGHVANNGFMDGKYSSLLCGSLSSLSSVPCFVCLKVGSWVC